MEISTEKNVWLSDDEKETVKVLIESQEQPHISVIRYMEAMMTRAYRHGENTKKEMEFIEVNYKKNRKKIDIICEEDGYIPLPNKVNDLLHDIECIHYTKEYRNTCIRELNKINDCNLKEIA